MQCYYLCIDGANHGNIVPMRTLEHPPVKF